MIKTPRISKCFLLFAIIFLCQYGIEHAIYLLTDAVYSGSIYMSASVLSVIRLVTSYLIQGVETLSLAMCAVLVLVAFLTRGLGYAASLFGVSAAAKLLYIAPHYYMTIFSYGYDSLETLLLLLPIAICVLILMLAEISAAIALGSIPAALKAKRDGGSPRELIREGLSVHELLDVANHGTSALAIIAAATSLKSLIMTIVDTVSFFAEQGSGFSGTDLLVILFDFFYVFALIVISYFLMHALKRRLIPKEDESTDGDDPENKPEEDKANEGY